MSSKTQTIALFIVLFVLAGCVQQNSFARPDVSPVQGGAISSSLQFYEGLEAGPSYDVSLDLPASWQGDFQTRNTGNALYVEHLGTGQGKALFWIEALSPQQYWQSSGGYPNSHTNIVNKGDTYFVYHMPIDSYYTGLSEDEFATFSAVVPDIVSTFVAKSSG